MKRYFYTTVVILFVALRAAAQDSHGDVVIHSDPRLSILLNKKKQELRASVAKPVTHQSSEKRMAMATHPAVAHTSAESVPNTPATGKPVASAAAKPVPGTIPAHVAPAPAVPVVKSESKPETKPVAEPAHPVAESHPAAPVTHYVREREGRVIYSGKGFRVQIYSGHDREKAIMVKTEFMRRFPATRTYLSYLAPSFRVKVGNYRNRSDAAGMLREAKEMYTPCVIVPDNITINSK